MAGGKMRLSCDDMGDQHGAYSSKNSNADKIIYKFDQNTNQFKMHRNIGYSVDNDILYYKGEFKENVIPISTFAQGK